ncbi:MAG: cytochrome c oxidase cbb3-type subunit 2 [Candidatus Pelagisphaera sp.]|jgi:cytochrome c oxidase cbb3-type subunit 2
MNRGPFIFLGVFIILSLTWALVINKPIQETGHLSPVFDVEQGGRLPSSAKGGAAQGKLVYQEFGCVACHTQQIRVSSGFDLQRGWGDRQSVARDYIDQTPVLIGNTRLGPDLSNVGKRRSDTEWHLLHFYNPQITSKGSNMPGMPFLFETREIVGELTNRALKLPAEYAVGDGYEVVPSRKAEALVAYMKSLKVTYDLKEAPKSNDVMLEELTVALENAK